MLSVLHNAVNNGQQCSRAAPTILGIPGLRDFLCVIVIDSRYIHVNFFLYIAVRLRLRTVDIWDE